MRCWLHKDVDFVKDAKDDSGADQYRRVPCSAPIVPSTDATTCVYEYSIEKDTSSNGAADGDVDDLEECKEACNDDEDCLGFDWDEDSDSKCWLHTDEDDFKDSNDRTGVDQYTKEECVEGKI